MPSSGVVLHAFGAGRFDYYALADNCARLVTKFLQLPITLVTDREPQTNLYDKVIICQSESNYQRTLRNVTDAEHLVQYIYKNDTRARSLEFSPYDQTILLDTDYLIFNSDLLHYLKTDYDFLCPWRVYDLTNRNSYDGFKYINNTIPQAWATVIVFNKSTASRAIFAHWQMIQDHYEYYSALLSVTGHYRNDYALSLAAHTMNGCQTAQEKLPAMFMLPGDSYIEKIDKNLNILINCLGRIIKVSKTNIHVMNKLCLQSDMMQKAIHDITS